jgi:hypothetical protein
MKRFGKWCRSSRVHQGIQRYSGHLKDVIYEA